MGGEVKTCQSQLMCKAFGDFDWAGCNIAIYEEKYVFGHSDQKYIFGHLPHGPKLKLFSPFLEKK